MPNKDESEAKTRVFNISLWAHFFFKVVFSQSVFFVTASKINRFPSTGTKYHRPLLTFQERRAQGRRNKTHKPRRKSRRAAKAVASFFPNANFRALCAWRGGAFCLSVGSISLPTTTDCSWCSESLREKTADLQLSQRTFRLRLPASTSSGHRNSNSQARDVSVLLPPPSGCTAPTGCASEHPAAPPPPPSQTPPAAQEVVREPLKGERRGFESHARRAYEVYVYFGERRKRY